MENKKIYEIQVWDTQGEYWQTHASANKYDWKINYNYVKLLCGKARIIDESGKDITSWLLLSPEMKLLKEIQSNLEHNLSMQNSRDLSDRWKENLWRIKGRLDKFLERRIK